MRGGFLVTRGLTQYHHHPCCHNRLSYARLTSFLHNWDRCQPNPKTWDKWVMTCAFRSSFATHTTHGSAKKCSETSLPCHLWAVSAATNPKNLRYIQQLTTACQSSEQFCFSLIFIYSFSLFLYPSNCAHFHKNCPTIALLGVQPWTWERESKGPVDQRPRLDIYNEALCLPSLF